MSSAKTQGIKDSLGNLLVYYYQALAEEGCADPKREIATVVPRLINLSEAQAKFIKDKIDGGDILDTLSKLNLILKGMEVDAMGNVPVDADQMSLVVKNMDNIIRLLGGNDIGN